VKGSAAHHPCHLHWRCAVLKGAIFAAYATSSRKLGKPAGSEFKELHTPHRRPAQQRPGAG